MDLKSILLSGMIFPSKDVRKGHARRDLKRILLDGYYRSVEAIGHRPAATDAGTPPPSTIS